MTIRRAVASDVPALTAMAQHFVAATPYEAMVPASVEHLEALTQQLLTVGVGFVAEAQGAVIGMIAGLAYPHYLTGQITASESVWWVEPVARGTGAARGLLHAFEDWAREQGASCVEIGAWHPRLERWYERLGYAPETRIFRKEIRCQ